MDSLSPSPQNRIQSSSKQESVRSPNISLREFHNNKIKNYREKLDRKLKQAICNEMRKNKFLFVRNIRSGNFTLVGESLNWYSIAEKIGQYSPRQCYERFQTHFKNTLRQELDNYRLSGEEFRSELNRNKEKFCFPNWTGRWDEICNKYFPGEKVKPLEDGISHAEVGSRYRIF